MPNQPRNPKISRKIRNTLENLNLDTFEILELAKEVEKETSFSMLEYYVIALEDRRFFSHSGIDIRSLIKNLWNKILSKPYGGFSTIDMQMVRTVTGFKERTYYRKFYEIILAFTINYKLSKKEILRIYLHKAFLGSRIYGTQSAAKKMYNKLLHELNDEESASIAAMLLRPKPLQPSQEWYKKLSMRSRYAQSVWNSIKKSYE